jgi:hypothetical protein
LVHIYLPQSIQSGSDFGHVEYISIAMKLLSKGRRGHAQCAIRCDVLDRDASEPKLFTLGNRSDDEDALLPLAQAEGHGIVVKDFLEFGTKEKREPPLYTSSSELLPSVCERELEIVAGYNSVRRELLNDALKETMAVHGQVKTLTVTLAIPNARMHVRLFQGHGFRRVADRSRKTWSFSSDIEEQNLRKKECKPRASEL